MDDKMDDKMAMTLSSDTATMIKLKQQQAEIRMRAELEQSRRNAMQAVDNLTGHFDPIRNQELLKVMSELSTSGRWKELEAMAQELAKYPAALNPAKAPGGAIAPGPVWNPGVAIPPGNATRARPRYTLQQKLCMRMGWEDLSDGGKLHVVHDSGKVFVFGVKNGESFTLQDEENIFPSDQMVTQLRMVCSE